MRTAAILPRVPQIGRRESFYASLARRAQEQHDPHLRAAAKVGQYITVANNPALEWEQKLTHYQHALKRHCAPPPWPDDEIWLFYRGLADLVRQHAGQVALRLASSEDDLYAARLAMGQVREKIEDDAEIFFARLIPGDGCPDWFNEADYETLKLIRNQWI
jgi:hypothetical protein